MQLSLGQRAALDHGLMLFNALWASWVSYLQEKIIMPDDIWSNAPSLCIEKNGGCSPSGLGKSLLLLFVVGDSRPGYRRGKGQSSLDEEEVPALRLYRITPADALEVSRSGSVVVNLPDVFQKLSDTAERAETGSLAKSFATFVEHGSER